MKTTAIFPRLGKNKGGFSKAWKISACFFQGLEKNTANFSNPWKKPHFQFPILGKLRRTSNTEHRTFNIEVQPCDARCTRGGPRSVAAGSPHNPRCTSRTAVPPFDVRCPKPYAILGNLLILLLPLAVLAAPPKPIPTQADVSYGPSQVQLLDVFVPTNGGGPFPVLVWYGGLWKPAKHAPDLNHFLPQGVAVVAVQLRTMTEAVESKVSVPVSYVMNDACRAVQFVRLNAARWKLDGQRIAVGGGSQGALPALYVGCAGERANAQATDAVERVSTRVTCVGAYRSQPSIDPQRQQEWVPGVAWGVPALGCQYEESLKRRAELLPVIKQWSPDWLLHKNAAPMYFENNWGLTRPADVKEMDYKVHSPAWGLGFQKLAQQAGAVCLLKYPGHPTEGYADIWDFIVKQLKKPGQAKFRPPAGQELISDFVFGTGGGRELHAEILRPKEMPQEPMPAVLLIHGGGWAGGSHIGYYAPWLVEKGYFTASIEYRLSGEAPWPAQIEDCKLAVRWLRANAAQFHVNPDRIGVMGHSAGGHLVACLGTLGDVKELDGSGGYASVSSRVQAVIDQAGPTDFTPEGGPAVGTNRTDHPGLVKLFSGTYAGKTAAWRQASPALHVAATTSPFMVMHGESDRLVPIAQAEHIVAALQKAGVPVEFIRIKNGGHGLRADKPGDPAAEPDPKEQQKLMLAFLDKYLKAPARP